MGSGNSGGLGNRRGSGPQLSLVSRCPGSTYLFILFIYYYIIYFFIFLFFSETHFFQFTVFSALVGALDYTFIGWSIFQLFSSCKAVLTIRRIKQIKKVSQSNYMNEKKYSLSPNYSEYVNKTTTQSETLNDGIFTTRASTTDYFTPTNR